MTSLAYLAAHAIWFGLLSRASCRRIQPTGGGPLVLVHLASAVITLALLTALNGIDRQALDWPRAAGFVGGPGLF